MPMPVLSDSIKTYYNHQSFIFKPTKDHESLKITAEIFKHHYLNSSGQAGQFYLLIKKMNNELFEGTLRRQVNDVVLHSELMMLIIRNWFTNVH